MSLEHGPWFHFPHPTRPQEPWCGTSERGTCTIVVDYVGCPECLLLEGFRSTDPATRRVQNREARKLRRELERHEIRRWFDARGEP